MAGEVQAVAEILKILIGEKQLGAAAPQFQPGESLGVGGGLFDTLEAIQQFSQPQDIASLTGPQGQELAPQVRAEEPVTSMPSVFNTQAQNQQGPFSSFFSNLDQNQQSPSKLIGLELLSQLGLFGQNRVF